MTQRRLHLESEVSELERLLAEIPDEDVIDRLAFEQRLDSVRSELDTIPMPARTPDSLRLTFRGTPVSGSHGVAADFAGKASNAFADAFAAIQAGLNSTLRYMGPIPDRIRNQLLITGTAVGSFGFEMELPLSADDLFADDNGADKAIEDLKNLLRASVEGTDDQVSDIIEEIHPRAVRKIADFLHVLSQNDAWCGIEFRNDYFKFSDVDQLALSEKRLREENFSERQEQYFGEFQGVLPHSRNFEFKVAEDDTIIKGKVDKSVDDPDILNRDWLHKPTLATFNVVQFGQGRPRFTLMSLGDLSSG
ncbi:hypothetical protein OEZ49_13240 [Ruegeria sp. WL0004]|uniref:Uncharacterized protein n=1 Tax=Ruegeria marisflavi TaxID=2984152 RepID=A0ABT2WU43_9RHOB|nr:hypothetical protein [Ruegeria sp. WL0004]MCU9838737.1 hypothetical protein [Ruegeria sp. WL0004]